MKIAEGQKKCFSHHVAIKSSQEPELYRGVSSYSKMDGQAVMRREKVPLPGGTFYSAKTWVVKCPPCPPAIDAPAL